MLTGALLRESVNVPVKLPAMYPPLPAVNSVMFNVMELWGNQYLLLSEMYTELKGTLPVPVAVKFIHLVLTASAHGPYGVVIVVLGRSNRVCRHSI